MVYTRGTFEDYDRYAAVTNDSTWSWNSVQEFFARVVLPFLIHNMRLSNDSDRMKDLLFLPTIITFLDNMILDSTASVASTLSALRARRALLGLELLKQPLNYRMSSRSAWI